MKTLKISWKKLPDDVNFSQFTNNHWSYSSGGEGLQDNEWSINYTHPNGDEDRYILPKALNDMINRIRVLGSNEAKREMRKALGI
jgi:hypothetical protein